MSIRKRAKPEWRQSCSKRLSTYFFDTSTGLPCTLVRIQEVPVHQSPGKSGVEPESPGSQPSTLPLSYISMVPMGLIQQPTRRV